MLAATRVLLLDFDGPVCKIFSARPASHVTAQLLAVVDGAQLDAVSESDPLSVLRAVGARQDQELLAQVDRELRRLEVDAARTARPTPFAAEAIRSAVSAGRKVAIVSNNSAEAIEVYLRQAALNDEIALIVGRPFAAPERMKPDPDGLADALARLQVAASQAVLIGDSVNDIAAAHRLGVRAVAFANRLEKLEKLSALRPDALIVGPDAMAEVSTAYSELAAL